MPAADAQSAALKVIRELFKERYAAARERDPKRAFARFLQQKAADTHDNPAARYVLYLEARDMAVAAGDASLLLGVLQDLGRQYRLDWQEMAVDTLVKAAKRPRDSLSNQALARLALETARGEMAKEDYDSATLLGEAAKEMARKAGDVRHRETGRRAVEGRDRAETGSGGVSRASGREALGRRFRRPASPIGSPPGITAW